MADEPLVHHGKHGRHGRDGRDGRHGIDGKNGRDGIDGKDGKDGKDGIDGKDGRDGIVDPRLIAAVTVEEVAKNLPQVAGAAIAAASAIAAAEEVAKIPRPLNGKDGTRGPKGDKGDKGDIGPIPAHEWLGTKLRFQVPSGGWGEAVDLRGPAGRSGNGGGSSWGLGAGEVSIPVGAISATGTPSATTYLRGDGSWATVSGGTFDANVQTFLETPTSANLAAALTDETGSGAAVFADTPTLVTPNIGVATATSVNKVAITAPATGATLTIADGKTLTASNTLTLAGTDSTTMTFPSTSATIARTDAAQTFTGTQTFSSALALLATDTTIALLFGTADSTHPALRRNATAIEAIRGDGAVFIPMKASSLRALSYTDETNFVILGGLSSGAANCAMLNSSQSNYVSCGVGSLTIMGLSNNTGDLFLVRSAAATLQQGAANAASPVAQTLQAQGSRSGTDTNVAGANYTIRSGAGTGNATPSTLILQSYVAVASGTGAQTATTGATINTGGVDVGVGGLSFPTSDPHIAGRWWDNAGTLTKSSG